MVEVFKKCSEIALWEKRTGKASPELLPTSPVPTREPLPLNTSDSYSSDVQHIPPEGDEVLNRFIKKYSMPRISNPVSGSTSTVTASCATEYMSPKTSTSGSINTVTVSSNLGEPTPTTTTSNPTEDSTPHAEWKKTTGIRTSESYNTSGSMMRKRVEQSLPNQALTLFTPVGMAEDLTKVQLILCNEIKTELKAVKESIAAISFDDVQRKVTEATTMLEERMSSLEDQYNELKELIIHRTTQNLITHPTLLDLWNPADMVMKHSPWTSMRLALNKVASENITDLFPTDWPTISSVQEKQYKVLTEVMTEMLQQCGLLIEPNIMEMDNYQDF